MFASVIMPKFKQPIDEKSVTLSLGLLLAALHFFGTLVLFAGGQRLLDWFHAIHFISVSEVLQPFDAMTLGIGTVTAFIAGAIVGWLFAVIWNWCVKRK